MNKNVKIEFGDFQTPKELTDNICELLVQLGIDPQTIIEPTCGLGAFVLSSSEHFKFAQEILGFDLKSEYLDSLRPKTIYDKRISLETANFFLIDWEHLISSLATPVLILGNPPWVTNAKLGSLNSYNLPVKSNFQKHNGFEALTGKSNFDISEWMLINLIKWSQKTDTHIAMLVKLSVARKLLKHIWSQDLEISNVNLFKIDSNRYFNVSVPACLFICRTNSNRQEKSCQVFEELSLKSGSAQIGYKNNNLISNLKVYQRYEFLDEKMNFKWRSGVKHDLSKIMELKLIENDNLINGLGEIVDLEKDFVYPFLKSSDLSKNDSDFFIKNSINRFVIITQKKVNEPTELIKIKYPKTWKYLNSYKDLFDDRKSSIYKDKYPFSIFGIGEYSFYPYKVAISGLYKNLNFSLVSTIYDKPVMLDDTCNFLYFNNLDQANLILMMLKSSVAQDFYNSIIFWDNKRPITIEILNRLNLSKLAKYLSLEEKFNELFPDKFFI